MNVTVTAASLRQFLLQMLPSDNAVFTTKDERIVTLLSSSVVRVTDNRARTLPTSAQVDSHRNAVHDILLHLLMRRRTNDENNVLVAGLWLHEETRIWQIKILRLHDCH
jgi:hypothetical protein